MPHTHFSSEDTAPEKSTIGIKVDFVDEDGTALAPDTMTWTLTSRPARAVAAEIINGRQDVTVASPSESNTVVLSGNDLAFLTSEDEEVLAERVFTVEFTYTSTLGSNLPGKAQYIFAVERLFVFED